MATATKNVVEVPDPPYTVTLELTQDEAQHLRWVLGEMNALNDSLYRIYRAFSNAGVTRVRPPKNPFTSVDRSPFDD